MIESDSMNNTPPCYTIYMLGLVLEWLETQGGVEGINKLKVDKAKILYDALDDSEFYSGNAQPQARSYMNITFKSPTKETDEKFAKEAAAAGFENLAGHRSVGGLRASIYNAMPIEGVVKLVEFMRNFEMKNK